MVTPTIFLLFYFPLSWSYLPDYWRGKYSTTWNGTMSKKIPGKILGRILTYEEMALGETTNQKIEDALAAQAIQINLPPSTKLNHNKPPENVSGTFHKVFYEQGFMTYMEVLDEFNFDGNQTVPVRFGTSWYNLNLDKSYNHSNYLLDQAVRNENVLAFTFKVDYVSISEEQSKEVNKHRKWEIDEMFCYYEHGVGELIDGRCMIPYTMIIDHYLRLWKMGKLNPSYFNGAIKQVTNNLTFIKNYPCGISDNVEHIQSCQNDTFPPIYYVPIEQEFLNAEFVYYQSDVTPVGIGKAIDFTFGINKTKGTYDVNFTMIFEKWTADLPDGLLRSYRDFSFLYKNFQIEIHYWIADPETPKIQIQGFNTPKLTTKRTICVQHFDGIEACAIGVRDVPGDFLILIIILLIPGCVIGVAILVACLMRTKKGFIFDVWEYWAKKRLISRSEYEKKQLEQAYARALEKKNKREIEMLDIFKQNNIHGFDEQFLRH